MGTINMAEPTTSTAAAGFAGWKLLGGLAGLGAIGAGMAALVVMCMTRPKNDREWVVALISTFVVSIGGCAGIVVYFNLQQAMTGSFFGFMALGGMFFACGLPGWALVRWMFNYIAKRESAGLDEVIADVRGAIKP
jgi:hypothetical protein